MAINFREINFAIKKLFLTFFRKNKFFFFFLNSSSFKSNTQKLWITYGERKIFFLWDDTKREKGGRQRKRGREGQRERKPTTKKFTRQGYCRSTTYTIKNTESSQNKSSLPSPFPFLSSFFLQSICPVHESIKNFSKRKQMFLFYAIIVVCEQQNKILWVFLLPENF